VLPRGTDAAPLTAEAAWDGFILDAPRGAGGFGYDPYFWLPELDKTSAELTPEEKNRLSHRGKAMRALREALLAQLGAHEQIVISGAARSSGAAGGARVMDASLALYVHMPWCVRKCPYLRFQFASVEVGATGCVVHRRADTRLRHRGAARCGRAGLTVYFSAAARRACSALKNLRAW